MSTPTYNIFVNKTTVKTGETIFYTIVTTNVADGTLLYLTDAGTCLGTDFEENLASNRTTVTVINNIATLTRTVKSTFNNSKTSIIQVRPTSYTTSPVATASTVNLTTASIPTATSVSLVINDTSKQTFTLTVSDDSNNPFTSSNPLTEGKRANFKLTTLNVNPGTSVGYKIEGVDTSDLSGVPVLTGSFVIPGYAKPEKNNISINQGWVLDSTYGGVYRKRNEILAINDPLFWGINSLSGASLTSKIAELKGFNLSPGILWVPAITGGPNPYGGPAKTNNDLLTELSTSGADFVMIYAYYLPTIFPGWSSGTYLSYLPGLITSVRNLNKKVKILIQGFAESTADVSTVNSLITSLLALSNIDEFVRVPWGGPLPTGWVEVGEPFPDQTITTQNSFLIVNDFLTEGTERIKLTLTGPGRTESAFADIIDTSRTAASPTFSLAKNIAGSSLNEGQSVTFTLTTTNVANGVLVPFTLTPGSGFTLNDLADSTRSYFEETGSFTGNFVINNNAATFTVSLASDGVSEGAESFTFFLTNTPAETFTITVNDTSVSSTSYTLTRSTASVNEGGSFVIYLATTPAVPIGTKIPYSVTGINASDLDTTSAGISGEFTIADTEGNASLNFVIKSDLVTEGSETFTLTLTGPDRSESISVTVNDTSLTPTQTFSLHRSVSSVNEGSSFAIILQTTGVATGTNVPYTITGVSSADISSASLTGNFTTNVNGGASLVLTAAADFVTEGTETFTLSLNGRSETISVSINDTSVVTYELFVVPTNKTVNEGQTIEFGLTAYGIPDGSVVPFNIVGINIDDIETSVNLGALSGSFVMNPTLTTPNKSGPVYLTFRNDIKTEGDEVGTISLNNGLASNTFTILDTSPSPPLTPGYSLSTSSPTVNEGGSVIFYLQTVNVATDTVLPYTLTGVTTADIVGGSLTGNFTVNALGQALVTINIVSDNLTEGTERLRLTVNSTTEFADVLILDTSLTPLPTRPVYTLTSNTSSIREGQDVAIILSTTNLGAGTFVPYTLSGISSGDVNVPLTGGRFALNASGQSYVVISALSDLLTEGTETLKLTIVDDSSAFINVNILDTSVGLPTFTLSSNVSGPIGEGNSVVFIVTTTNLPTGTSIPWKITGINVTSGDIGGSALAGNFSTNVNGGASVEIPLSADVLPEGTELLRFALDGRTEFLNVTILDTSKPPQTFSLSASSLFANEGSTVKILLTTAGTVQGLNIPYEIIGTVDRDDYQISTPLSFGNFTLLSNLTASVNFYFTTDFVVEGNELFTLRLTETDNKESITITVSDFSYSATVPANFVESIPSPIELDSNILIEAFPTNTVSIPTLAAISNRPSAFVKNIIPEYTR